MLIVQSVSLIVIKLVTAAPRYALWRTHQSFCCLDASSSRGSSLTLLEPEFSSFVRSGDIDERVDTVLESTHDVYRTMSDLRP